MADQSDTFMREVQEEMRRERLAHLWDRYGIIAIGLAVALVLGVAFYQYSHSANLAAREKAGREFEAAALLARDGKTEDAQKAFESMVKSAPGGYGALARLRNAGGLVAEKKRAEAVAAYDAVAKDAGTDVLLRDFAAMQAALLRVDEADWTEMQNRLKDLTSDTNAWRAPARELLGLAALKAGHQDEARKAFEQVLADTSAPPSTAERARVMMTILTEAAIAKMAPAAKEAAKDGAAKESPAKEGTPTPPAGAPPAATK